MSKVLPNDIADDKMRADIIEKTGRKKFCGRNSTARIKNPPLSNYYNRDAKDFI